MAAKWIGRNCQTPLRANDSKQGESDNAIFVETLDTANDIARSEDYIFNFEHGIIISNFGWNVKG